MVNALLTVDGKASLSFHTPSLVSPTFCPTRSISYCYSCASYTHGSLHHSLADARVYARSPMGACGSRAGLPNAADMEEQKRKWAGVEKRTLE